MAGLAQAVTNYELGGQGVRQSIARSFARNPTCTEKQKGSDAREEATAAVAASGAAAATTVTAAAAEVKTGVTTVTAAAAAAAMRKATVAAKGDMMGRRAMLKTAVAA